MVWKSVNGFIDTVVELNSPVRIVERAAKAGTGVEIFENIGIERLLHGVLRFVALKVSEPCMMEVPRLGLVVGV